MADWRIVITGCGTSHGNPPWGLPAMWSEDVRDRRRRSGALLLGPRDEVIIIDVGPDLAHQLRDPYATWDGLHYPSACIVRCDGVLLTHDHADHAHGINDLRHLNRLMGGTSIPIYGNAEHLQAVQSAFPFCFGHPNELYQYGAPAVTAVAVPDGAPFSLAGLHVTGMAMSHGPAGRTTGWRCGGLAYLTDLKELPEASVALLHGLDLLVLDMLRDTPHPTHLCWAEAQDLIARLAPTRTVLTHMGHEVRFREWQARLPAGVSMAYDGLTCPFTNEDHDHA